MSTQTNGAAPSEEQLRDENYSKFLDVVHNVMTTRKDWLKSLMDPRRDINDECGYPASLTGNDGRKLYQDLYDREPVPNRVVNCLARETWQVQPEVYEDDNPKVTTPFEEQWTALGRQLHGENWHQEEMGSPIWEYLKRADELSGIGQYGVILLGLDDGLTLDKPAYGIDTQDTTEPWDGSFVFSQARLDESFARNRERLKQKGSRGIYFLRVFPESLLDITQWETNLSNPRFGQPVGYHVTFFDPSLGIGTTAIPSTKSLAVHWSRVVHVADNLTSSEVFGIPRMRPVLNRLLDLRKLYAGSAEMYWKGAFPGISLESHPSLGGEAVIDYARTRTEMEDTRTASSVTWRWWA